MFKISIVLALLIAAPTCSWAKGLESPFRTNTSQFQSQKLANNIKQVPISKSGSSKKVVHKFRY